MRTVARLCRSNSSKHGFLRLSANIGRRTNPRMKRGVGRGNWMLGFPWCLGFGIWRFSSCLFGLLPERRFQLIELLTQFLDFTVATVQFRSEERRVGKECRSRWSLEH